MGAAAALDLKDMAFTQYREPGILMWRDFGMQVQLYATTLEKLGVKSVWLNFRMEDTNAMLFIPRLAHPATYQVWLLSLVVVLCGVLRTDMWEPEGREVDS